MRQDMASRVGGDHATAIAVDATPQPDVASVPAPARLGYVDGLRALAALYVMAYHMTTEIWPRHAPSGSIGIIASLLSYGRLAVSVFIILSGFSLMLPVARKNYRLPQGIGGFYWRRARRILPPYYFAMALSLLLIWLAIGSKTGTSWDMSLGATWQNIVQHILLVQDFVFEGYQTINSTFWSIAEECQIYLLFPALVLLWRRYPPLPAMLFAVLFSLALTFLLILTWVGRLPGFMLNEFTPQYIGLFAMGMFAASIYTRPTPRWTLLMRYYLWDALAICGFTLLVWHNNWPIYQLDPFVSIGTVGLLLAASRPGRLNPIHAALGWRPLVWIGGISYSVYLIHAPLIQLLWQYALHPLGLGDVATYLLLLLVGAPLIVLASWGFWYFCERPFLNTHAGAPRLGGWLARRRSWRFGERLTETPGASAK